MIALSYSTLSLQTVIFLTLAFGLIIAGFYAYRLFANWRADQLRNQNKPLRVGLPSAEDFGLAHAVGDAFRSFISELIEHAGHRLNRRVEIVTLPAKQYEQALTTQKVDLFILDGAQGAQTTSTVDTVACSITALSSLALVFWDKMPYHVQSLEDFSCYPYNSTVVMSDSIEDQYLSHFGDIRTQRVHSVADLILQLKLGLVRAGLMRVEHANSLKREYGNLKYVPVSLQKEGGSIQDEKIGIARNNTELRTALESVLAQMRHDDTVRQLHAKWFGN